MYYEDAKKYSDNIGGIIKVDRKVLNEKRYEKRKVFNEKIYEKRKIRKDT